MFFFCSHRPETFLSQKSQRSSHQSSDCEASLNLLLKCSSSNCFFTHTEIKPQAFVTTTPVKHLLTNQKKDKDKGFRGKRQCRSKKIKE